MLSGTCQGLQTCLEPRVCLRLKLAPSKSNFSRSIASTRIPDSDPPKENSKTEQITTTTITKNNKNNSDDDYNTKSHQNVDMGGWSFLHSLANTSHSNKEAIDNNNNNNKVYVHPLVKRSSSMLSEKSLEMCTESLGSETGSDVSESSDDISLLSLETRSCEIKKRSKSCDNFVTKRMSRNKSFPPPLTSISGSTGVQVRPHREGGRLVLQAVPVSTCHTYFHAERSEGRLRLSLLKDCSPICDNKEVENEKEEEDEEVGDKNGVQIEAEEEEEEEEEEQAYWGEDIEGDSGNVGGEIGMGKLPRPSRCKEGGPGNDGLLNWEPFWVAPCL